jgi:hypothetical protein
MVNRLLGVITLKAPVYREIAEDKNATGQAAAIVIIMALITGIVGAALLAAFGSALPVGTPTASPVGAAVRTIIIAIVGWLVGGWVLAFVAKTFFGGKTDTGEMLRVYGFTQIFQILAIIPCIGWLIALVLSLIGAVIGIREAAAFDTTKAILTGVVAFVILLIVSVILSLALAFLG